MALPYRDMWLDLRHDDQARGLRMDRLLPVACVILALAGCLAATTPEAAPVRRVILISIDTLRADRLGAYGYPRPTSPVLDRFASDGTRFATCIAASPWTLPSHISMLTGLYPARHGAIHVRRPLRTGVPMLSDVLRDQGFRTAAIVASDLVLPDDRCRRSFEHYHEIDWRGSAPGPWILNTGAEITTEATTWLETLESEDPFFLFLHYYDVHSDYLAEPRFRTLLGAADDLEPGSSPFLTKNRKDGSVTETQRQQAERLYDAEIRQLDTRLGTLFDTLRRLDLWNRTLIIVTSDHGEEFQEHGRLLHGRALYEESMHVPLLMRGPGIPQGRVITGLTSHVDITPTILAATGATFDTPVDGSSLLPALAGVDTDRPEFVVSEAAHGGKVRMIRTARFKLIDHRDRADELFDLQHDPEERINIIERERERHAVLARQLASTGRDLPQNPAGRLTTTDRERLRVLGYVD